MQAINTEIKPFTDEEIHDLVVCEAEMLDFDATLTYFVKIAEVDSEDIKDCSPLKKAMWMVRHGYLDGFRKGITVFNDLLKLILEENPQEVEMEKIKIFPCFTEHPPKAEKMQQKEQYFTETGLLQSQIILDSQDNLIDGYTSYLIAKAHGIQSVTIKRGKRQIVRARHKRDGKLYTWELPGILIDRVHIGDKVTVSTERGIRTVTAAAVEEYAGQEQKPLRMVVGVKNKQR